VPHVYCDHNFVVSAHDGQDEYKNRLRELSAIGKVSFVLSTWHWLEMARDKDESRGLSVAAFADSLTPEWFFERLNVQRREVEHAFFRSLDLPHQQQPCIGGLAEAIADLTGATPELASNYRDSGAFVRHMHALGDNHPINAIIDQNFVKQRLNGEAYRAGRITDEMLRCLDKICIGSLLPCQTPQGTPIDRATKDKFLQSCSNNEFPSWAVEAAFSLDGWQMGRVLNDRAFRDSQHVVSIPYVDFFVTDDGSFESAIKRIAGQLPFRTAETISKAEFDQRFLGG
jgi:hypothetical protein